MTDVRSAWSDAGEKLSGLGASLKAHYARQRGTDGEQTRREVDEAVTRLKDVVQDAVEAVGAAAKDPAVKDDVKKVGQSLSDALTATFAEVSEDLRRTLNQRKGQAGAAGGAAAGTTAATTAPGGTTPAQEPGAEPGAEPAAEDHPPLSDPLGTQEAGHGGTGSGSSGDEPHRTEPWGPPRPTGHRVAAAPAHVFSGSRLSAAARGWWGRRATAGSSPGRSWPAARASRPRPGER